MIACAVVPWIVAIVRSWPASEPEAAHVARTAAVVDPWSPASCPSELRALRQRPYWLLRGEVHGDNYVFVVTARAQRHASESEWLLSPAERASILDNLRAQCAAGTVDRLDDDPLAMSPIADPVLVFDTATSGQIIVQVDTTTLRFDGYGATAR